VVDADCNVTIVENVSRGKVVMEGGGQATTNLPIVEAVACAVCCPPDQDDDVDLDLVDYYAIQGNLIYADYLLCYGCGSSYTIPKGDATVGHLYNACADGDSDNDIDLADYYALQGTLIYADYLKCYGCGSSYSVDGPTDPIAGGLWPCP
jgi:hypothetical protein